MKGKSHLFARLITITLFSGFAGTIWAQTQVEPGFNLFSVDQDIEIGRESAKEIEQQLPVLTNEQVQNYVQRIGERLDRVAPGPDFPYQFKVLNISDVNAFALPGGYMYINRGLIEAAGSEAELAGVMAHEMAHVALRHGTNQASKAYLAQAGLSLLGTLLGGGNSTTADMIGAIGGFGLNTVFLQFSRSAEEQADILGAQMLVDAGYDPMAMAEFFETLRDSAGGDPGKVEQFFSSHPAPSDRAQRIEEETRQLGPVRKVSPVGNFRNIQSILNRMSSAPSMKELSSNQ